MPNRTQLIALVAAVCAIVVSALLVLALWPTSESTVSFFVEENEFEYSCEVADTSSERVLGLMNRDSLPADEGMLFVYDEPANLTFWMKNTLIPLDIIFIDLNGRVINIEEAMPEPGVPDAELTRYSSLSPAMWVVELNMGTCSGNGIAPGTIVSIDIDQ